jgi:hypothetical protein
MLASFGGGSARGFGFGSGSPGLDEFTLTLSNATTYPVLRNLGDTDAQINSFYSTNLTSDPGYVSSSGTALYKPYTGYYSMQLGVDCTVNIRCKGASAGYPVLNSTAGAKTLGYGRDVEGTFSLSANDILVWGVGKTGENGVSGGGSAGGGATFCYKRVGFTDTILVVGAGGSGTPNYASWQDQSRIAGSTRPGNSAVPLSAKGTGNHSAIISSRAAKTNLSWYNNTHSGGVGRSAAGGGGGGFNNSGRDKDGAINTNFGRGLLTSNANFEGGFTAPNKRGGFGGGGGHVGTNGYSAGGGGYFGGMEVGNVPGAHTAYAFFVTGNNLGYDTNLGPVSYVENSAISFTDNGIYGSPINSGPSSDPLQGGEIIFTFNT